MAYDDDAVYTATLPSLSQQPALWTNTITRYGTSCSSGGATYHPPSTGKPPFPLSKRDLPGACLAFSQLNRLVLAKWLMLRCLSCVRAIDRVLARSDIDYARKFLAIDGFRQESHILGISLCCLRISFHHGYTDSTDTGPSEILIQVNLSKVRRFGLRQFCDILHPSRLVRGNIFLAKTSTVFAELCYLVMVSSVKLSSGWPLL
jgi:hypothetical protein